MFVNTWRSGTRGYCRDCVGTPSSAGSRSKARRGAAAVFGLFLILSLIVMMGVTLDLGNIRVAQSEMRRAADSAAMAGCWEMHDVDSANPDSSDYRLKTAASEGANGIAYHNLVGQGAPQLSSADVLIGEYDGSTQQFDPSSSDRNAVRVTLRRNSWVNGELPLFFGSLTGRETQELHTTATAAMFSQIIGFNHPESDESHGILPIALDWFTWMDAVNGVSSDVFAFRGNAVGGGSDGVSEANLYPQGTGSPGNRGTVDIGGDNNTTNDLARQVLYGISRQDLIDLGKPLAFDGNGELELNGDTGISAGIKDELATLIGKTRIIPIFTKVRGNGNNAMFTIVRFEGVRILDVKLTGPKNKKRVIIQPAKVLARNTIIDFDASSSSHLVTPVMLVE